MGKKNVKLNFGKSLIKDRFGKKRRTQFNDGHQIHSVEIDNNFNWNVLNHQSVIEETSFQEFFNTAELAGVKFQTEKLNIKFSESKHEMTLKKYYGQSELLEKKNEILKIPRRPKWDKTMSSEELQIKEKEQFSKWKKNLAKLKDINGLLVTPYEKNLEYWKQLWRVIERSNVIVQVVDARNPLLFRCEDLENYVKEVDLNKTHILLLNKADFLTIRQREIWTEYFSKINVQIAFFSTILDIQNSNIKEIKSKKSKEEINLQSASNKSDINMDISGIVSNLNNKADILNRNDLILLFQTIHMNQSSENPLTIGLVGYPNVGKSSIINTLFVKKKVSISSTPGKTKHFQTLYLNENLILCDCPGLVMPSIIRTKAEMILNGILPINQIQDYISPMNLLGTLISRNTIEEKYSMTIPYSAQIANIDQPLSGTEILNAHGYHRGYMRQNGQPDNARSARVILNDFVNGKLLHCTAPPNYNQDKFHPITSKQNKFICKSTTMKVDRTTIEDLDKLFFEQSCINTQVQKKNIQLNSTVPLTIESSSNRIKPWRIKKNKKWHEKSRKICVRS